MDLPRKKESATVCVVNNGFEELTTKYVKYGHGAYKSKKKFFTSKFPSNFAKTN